MWGFSQGVRPCVRSYSNYEWAFGRSLGFVQLLDMMMTSLVALTATYPMRKQQQKPRSSGAATPVMMAPRPPRRFLEVMCVARFI